MEKVVTGRKNNGVDHDLVGNGIEKMRREGRIVQTLMRRGERR